MSVVSIRRILRHVNAPPEEERAGAWGGRNAIRACSRAERGTIPGRLHGSHRRNRNELQRVVVRPLSWLEMGCCAALHRSPGQWIAINPEGFCRHFKECSILLAQYTREAESAERTNIHTHAYRFC